MSLHRKIWPWIATLIILLVGAAFMVVPFTSSKTETAALVKIPKGADEVALSDTLTKYFGSGYARKTMSVARMFGGEIAGRNGAYLIEEGTNPIMCAKQIMRGAQTPVKITINSFRDINSLLDRIANKMEFSAADLKEVAFSDSVLQTYGVSKEQLMGVFLNDTYEVYWNASPQNVIGKIGTHYQEVWNEDRRRKAEALGMTPAEVVVLCSIVDEETNAEEEKGRIGRLYWNRLQRGMKLQADPTVRFAVGDFTIKRVKGEHLAVNSPYNTYKHAGLPPGPIRTTSIATIDAFLNSSPSDDIYMCADERFSGRHNFSANYEEHLANARRYQEALDKMGIR